MQIGINWLIDGNDTKEAQDIPGYPRMLLSF